jgi:hypothetical protein
MEPEDSLINIISFGSDYQSMFNKPVKITEKIIKNACNEINSFKADYGGTEMYNPINYVLKCEINTLYPRNIFLLTDGGISQPDNVINLISSYSHNIHVHTIGIGSGVDEYLVKSLANKGKGTYELLSDNENIRPKVISQLTKTMKPSFVDFDVNISTENNKGDIELCFDKNKQPVIYNGESLTFFFYFNDEAPQNLIIEIKYSDNVIKKQYTNKLNVNSND